MSISARRIMAAMLCAAALAGHADAAIANTQEITGNTIIGLAGRGDTLWMSTTSGLNFTLDTADTALSWWGYKTSGFSWYGAAGYFTPLALGDGLAVISMVQEYRTDVRLWVYNHRTASAFSGNIVWNNALIDTIEKKNDSLDLVFSASAIEWTPGSFWLACGHGGLVRADAAALASGKVTASVFLPGVDSVYRSENFPPVSAIGYPPAAKAVTAVATGIDSAGAAVIWVATPRGISRLSLADTTWDTLSSNLAEPGKVAVSFEGIFVRPGRATPTVLAAIATHPAKDTTTTTALYRFDTAAKMWKLFYAGNPAALSFGTGDTFFIVNQGTLLAFRESVPGEPVIAKLAFERRMLRPEEAVPIVNKVLFVPRQEPAAGRLWIATSNGLYYGSHEPDSGAFILVKRSPVVESGLGKSYFYPTILTHYEEESVGYFAYNLARDGNVTIRVYDWNMDLVKTVISGKRRLAGKGHGGRSTDKREDRWDGTTGRGNPVAPGVYYYEITSSSGERGFGKIIVAK